MNLDLIIALSINKREQTLQFFLPSIDKILFFINIKYLRTFYGVLDEHLKDAFLLPS